MSSTSCSQNSRPGQHSFAFQRLQTGLKALLLALMTAGVGLAQTPVQTEQGGKPSVTQLSLKKAVEIALAPEGNSRVQLALDSV